MIKNLYTEFWIELKKREKKTNRKIYFKNVVEIDGRSRVYLFNELKKNNNKIYVQLLNILKKIERIKAKRKKT